jgi:multicomponent Na+:H+ antiporter subunit D
VAVVGPAALGLLLQAFTAQPQLVADARVQGYLAAAGLATAWFGAAAALAPAKLRRVLGYVLIADLGYVMLGLTTLTRIGVAGAVLHMAQRSLVTLVLLGATAELERDDRGATDGARPAPYMWGALLLASLTLLGVPPLAGLAANWAVYQALSLSDWRLAMALAGSSFVCLVAVLSSLGRLRRDYTRPWRRPRPAETALLALAVLTALWGLAPGPALGAIHAAVSQLPFLKPF